MAKDPSMGPGSTTTSAGAGYGSGAFGMDAEQARPYIPGRIPEQNFALNDGRTNRPGHNFLAPYSNTSDQTIAFSLATKDFLQPLERVERDKSERCYDVANPSSNQHLLCFKDKVENCWSSARLQCGIADAVAKIGSTVEPSLVNNHWQHQKSEILSSGKRSRQGSEDDDIEEVENADIRRRKRENGGQKKGLCKDESTSKITETSKPVSSRSKHSATEQRRRSKINDRFQMLRDLIPHGDQKRDKASFLLEVCEYIQILQEKLHKYDSTEEKTSLTATKIPQRNNDGPSNEKEDSEQLLDNKQIQQQQYTTTLPQQQQQCTSSNGVFHHENKVDETTVTNTSNSKKKNKKKKQAEEVTGGVISVSTGYSQRLLGTLADALQSSGVDLSQAKISVHINIGEAS